MLINFSPKEVDRKIFRSSKPRKFLFLCLNSNTQRKKRNFSGAFNFVLIFFIFIVNITFSEIISALSSSG